MKVMCALLIAVLLMISGCWGKSAKTDIAARKNVNVSHKIEALEYEVMSAVISDELVNSPGPRSEISAYTGIDEVARDSLKVVIYPLTEAGFNVEDVFKDRLYRALKREWANLKIETYDDFVMKNFLRVWLDTKFDFDFAYHLMQEGEDDKYEESEDGYWEAFYEVYPRFIGVTSVSRVGFDANREQALIYVAQQQEGLSGSGVFYCLERGTTGWIVRARYLKYIS